MKFKRGETFRYDFTEDIPCSFQIISIEGKTITSQQNEGYLLDLSPSGLKIFSSFEIALQKKPVLVFVEFTLIEQPIKEIAELIWKRNAGNGFHYGLRQLGSSEHTRLVIEELKKYVKKTKS